MFTLGLKETCGNDVTSFRHGNRLSGATLVDSKQEVCTGVLIFNQSTEQVPNDG